MHGFLIRTSLAFRYAMLNASDGGLAPQEEVIADCFSQVSVQKVSSGTLIRLTLIPAAAAICA